MENLGQARLGVSRTSQKYGKPRLGEVRCIQDVLDTSNLTQPYLGFPYKFFRERPREKKTPCIYMETYIQMFFCNSVLLHVNSVLFCRGNYMTSQLIKISLHTAHCRLFNIITKVSLVWIYSKQQQNKKHVIPWEFLRIKLLDVFFF